MWEKSGFQTEGKESKDLEKYWRKTAVITILQTTAAKEERGCKFLGPKKKQRSREDRIAPIKLGIAQQKSGVQDLGGRGGK